MIAYNNVDRGLGVVAIIAIIAVIGIGGVAAAKIYNEQKVAVDETERMEEINREVESAQTEARNDLLDLQTRLQTGADASIDMSLETVAEIRANLREAYNHGNAELDAELAEIEASLDGLEGEIRAGSQTAADTISRIVSSFDIDVDVDVDGDVSTENNGADTATTSAGGSATTSVDVNIGNNRTINIDGSGSGSGSVGY